MPAAPKSEESKQKERVRRQARAAFDKEYLNEFVDIALKSAPKDMKKNWMKTQVFEHPDHQAKWREHLLKYMKENGYPDFELKAEKVAAPANKFTAEVTARETKGGKVYKIKNGDEIITCRKKTIALDEAGKAVKKTNILMAVNAKIKDEVHTYRAAHPELTFPQAQKEIRDKFKVSPAYAEFERKFYEDHPKRCSAKPSAKPVIDLVTKEEAEAIAVEPVKFEEPKKSTRKPAAKTKATGVA